jgi:LuxR family maltose regulon positive regulatory protein
VIEGWAHYLLGLVTYEWNLPDAAGQHFAEVTRRLYTANLATVRNGFIGQALACQAMGRRGDALEAMDQLSRIDFEYHGREMDDTASARARLMLMQGNLEAAERWADAYTVLPDNESLVVWLEQPHLTRATILIARNKPGDVAVALQILDRIAETAERSHNNRVMIRTRALQALAQVARGDSVAARESLIRSVELARRGAFTRLYVDLGQPMRNLLLQTATNGATANTVKRILAAFADDGQETSNGQSSQSGYPTTNGQNGDVDERLTPRELEVLTLMREPVSVKVIAARLNITYATARRYTINVYSKFGVHSRWEAVEAAIQRGILPPR